jgi:glycogen phosphorylase
VPDFHEWKPGLFNNKTNGVTQRRWLLQSNPGLAGLLTAAVGPGWITDLDCLKGLEKRAGDAAFRAEFRAVKLANKERLAALVRETAGVTVDPAALFDVRIKRMHEYKRQLLNVLHVLHLWQNIVEDGVEPSVPRVVLFAGKAAPGYVTAKRIIHLINAVAAKVNKDPRVRGFLRVAFLPDYRVSLAERIVPAADLSE